MIEHKPDYMHRAATHCHRQVPMISPVGRGLFTTPIDPPWDTICDDVESRPDSVDVNGDMAIYQFDGSGHGPSDNMYQGGNCTFTIVHADDAYVLIDTGYMNEDKKRIADFIDGIMPSGRKFDAWIISHFHSDHCSGYQNIIDTGRLDANTDIFVQASPTPANDQYDGDRSYLYYRSLISAALAEAGLKKMQVPESSDDAIYSYGSHGGLRIRFYNTDFDPADYDANAWGQMGLKYYEDRHTTLNNYSLVAKISCGYSSFLETGDIEGYAQKHIADQVPRVTVARVPHHAFNKMGYEPFFNKISPKLWLMSNHFDGNDTDDHIPTDDWYASYMFRYLYYRLNDTQIVTNAKNTDTTADHVSIFLYDNDVMDYKGTSFDKAVPGTNNSFTAYNLLPPAFYHENPYYIMTMTLMDFFNDVFRWHRGYHQGCKVTLSGFDPNLQPGDTGFGVKNAKINHEIRDYFYHLWSTPVNADSSFFSDTIQLNIDQISLIAWYNSRAAPYNRIRFTKKSNDIGFAWNIEQPMKPPLAFPDRPIYQAVDDQGNVIPGAHMFDGQGDINDALINHMYCTDLYNGDFAQDKIQTFDCVYGTHFNGDTAEGEAYQNDFKKYFTRASSLIAVMNTGAKVVLHRVTAFPHFLADYDGDAAGARWIREETTEGELTIADFPGNYHGSYVSQVEEENAHPYIYDVWIDQNTKIHIRKIDLTDGSWKRGYPDAQHRGDSQYADLWIIYLLPQY